MEIIYKKFELHIAELLGWFGIVDTPNGYIGYNEGANPSKSFRSHIPQYIRNAESNNVIAITYDIQVSEYSDYFCGETYVAHFKDHKSKELARQYLIVMEAIEKIEEDIDIIFDYPKPPDTNIIEFKKKPTLIVNNYGYSD